MSESAFPRSRHTIATVALILILMAAAGWVAGVVAERRVVAARLVAMRTDAALRSALLGSEIARFRLLPLALSGDNAVMRALDGDPAALGVLNRKLESLSRRTGAAVIYVLRADGHAIAASNWRTPTSFVGQDYSFRRYYRQAWRTGEAAQFGLGTMTGRPGLYLARRTPGGGVIVVKLDFTRIERQWASAPGITLVENAEGVVLVTSEPSLRFVATHPLQPGRATTLRDEFGVHGTLRRWSPPPGSLSVTQPTAIGNWQLVLVWSRATALGNVVVIARAAGAALMLAIIAAIMALAGRARRRRAVRQAEQARTAELEAAVSARTGELRREMEERQASEAHAAMLREGLRQANRLATLGQVTASVAHETAQPVAAIRTYAATGARLLDRGDLNEVRGNLAAIDRLAGRIGTITDELRGFARKATEPAGPVPLAEVLDGACLILKDRLRVISLRIDAVPPDLSVIAGRVRLEQVLVNLLQNAAEALEGVAAPVITVSVAASEEWVRIGIADNGPGIAPDLADRLFTPFTTSRANGLGLGLVIAQDIAHDLGGTLRHVPSECGACFVLALARA